MRNASGNLYATTFDGGPGQCGTALELSPAGRSWITTVLYDFVGPGACGPLTGLVMDAGGNLYGTTWHAGVYNEGVVFKLTLS